MKNPEKKALETPSKKYLFISYKTTDIHTCATRNIHTHNTHTPQHTRHFLTPHKPGRHQYLKAKIFTFLRSCVRIMLCVCAWIRAGCPSPPQWMGNGCPPGWGGPGMVDGRTSNQRCSWSRGMNASAELGNSVMPAVGGWKAVHTWTVPTGKLLLVPHCHALPHSHTNKNPQVVGLFEGLSCTNNHVQATRAHYEHAATSSKLHTVVCTHPT